MKESLQVHAFGSVGPFDISHERILRPPLNFRPAEVETLLGDPTKARENPAGNPKSPHARCARRWWRRTSRPRSGMLCSRCMGWICRFRWRMGEGASARVISRERLRDEPWFSDACTRLARGRVTWPGQSPARLQGRQQGGFVIAERASSVHEI